MDWKIKFDREIQMAVQARQHGNEGQARVCTPRAAGVVVYEYFICRGVPVRNVSAYDLLKNLTGVTGLPEELKQAAEFLTLRVTEDFKLPVEGDLLQAARTLAKGLLQGPD